MKSLRASLLLLLGVLVQQAWSMPNSSPKHCAAPWILRAETVAKDVPENRVATLCSSLLSKYTTVTKTVYTATTTPTRVVKTASTVSAAVVPATKTVEVTKDVTSSGTTTTHFPVTVTSFQTTLTTDVATTTVTTSAPLKHRNIDNCEILGHLLHLESQSVHRFCSCKATGSTSTVKVTAKKIKTASAITVTTHTPVITRPVSSVVSIVSQTTTVVITDDTTVSLPSTTTKVDTVSETTTVTTASTAAATLLQVRLPGSPYDHQYAFIDTAANEFKGRPLQFTSDVSKAMGFTIDGSGYLVSTVYEDEQNVVSTSNDPSLNALFLATTNDISSAPVGEIAQPICSKLATGELSCAETGASDPRNVLQICPSTAATFGNDYPDTPFLVLDSVLDTACTAAIIFFIYS